MSKRKEICFLKNRLAAGVSRHCDPCVHYLSYRSSFLTPDRLEKLNSIGFVWTVRGESMEGGDDMVMPPSPKKEEKVEEEEDKVEAEQSVSI